MSSSSSASSHSPCAACKFLRRKCTQECVFSPYFPPEQPQKFAAVHRVFGASNVAKILSDMKAADREHAASSLAYEADTRLHDPVYGCLPTISYLENLLYQMRVKTSSAKYDLAKCYGTQAAVMMLQPFVESDPRANHLVPYQQQQMMYDAESFPGGFGAVVENGSYGNQAHHQDAVSGTVVDYQMQAHYGMLSGHRAHSNSDIVPRRNV